MKKSQSYMETLIRQGSSSSSFTEKETNSEYLKVITDFSQELLNFEAILDYYKRM